MYECEQPRSPACDLLAAEYVFAKTMPNDPHYYTHRKTWRDVERFDAAVAWVDAVDGDREVYRGRPARVRFLNGWKYWALPGVGERWGSAKSIINRKPQPPPSTAAQAYDVIAEQYDDLFDSPEDMQESRAVCSMAAAMLPSGGRLLDVGCGTGLMLDFTNVAKADYLGIDPSRRMLERLKAKHPGAEAVNTDVAHFHDCQGFDFVTALFGSASYLLADEWHKLKALLRPQGRLLAMFYADEYVPVTYQRSRVTVPHNALSTYDFTGCRLEAFKASFVMAEYAKG